MNLYVNPISQRQLDQLQQSESQSVLLTGPSGIGLLTITIETWKATGKRQHIVYPEKEGLTDREKGVISIENIRRLYDEMRTFDPQGRIIIIDRADTMGIPAQNAFLKLLEEPNVDTTFILLAHTTRSLLPTILSRVQKVSIRPISKAQSTQLLTEIGASDKQTIAQLLFIASGLPAALTQLYNDTARFAQRSAIVRDARQFLAASRYERLLLAKQYKDNRENALLLLQDAMKLIELSLLEQKNSQQFMDILNRLEQTHRCISEQGNIRLQLSALAMV